MSVPFALAVLFGGSGKSGYRVVEISQPQFDLVEFGWSVADRSAQDGGAVPWPGYLGARWKGALGRPGWRVTATRGRAALTVPRSACGRADGPLGHGGQQGDRRGQICAGLAAHPALLIEQDQRGRGCRPGQGAWN